MARATLNLRIDARLKAAAARAAKAERRTLTNLIEHLIERHLAAAKER